MSSEQYAKSATHDVGRASRAWAKSKQNHCSFDLRHVGRCPWHEMLARVRNSFRSVPTANKLDEFLIAQLKLEGALSWKPQSSSMNSVLREKH